MFSDVAGAHVLERAKRENIPANFFDPEKYTSRVLHDKALSRMIDKFNPQLIVLAGYMRILTGGFVEQRLQRIMSIHSSLLPANKGLNTLQRVLDAGESRHGTTVHFVTSQLDSGPTIAQVEFKLRVGDAAVEFQLRVHECEYEISPLAIQ